MIAQIIGSILTLFIAVLIYRFINLSKLYNIICYKDSIVQVVLGNSFIIVFGIILYSKISSDKFFQYFLIITLIMILILFINGEIFISHAKMQKQKNQLKMYQEYLPIVEQLIDQVRTNQHAHANNLQAIQMLSATCEDFDTLKAELIKYTDYLYLQNESSTLLKINMKLVGGFLYSKQMAAQAENKHLKISLKDNTLKTNVLEYDLITMLGILIDNALEATKPEGTVFAILGSSDNKIHFTIKNIGPTLSPEFCKNIFSKGYTTKENSDKSHGIGLYHLRKLTDQYSGDITLYNEVEGGNIFICFDLSV